MKKHSGKGTIAYDNGDVYEGKFENNEPHGVGKMTHKDGRISEGIWRKGKIVYEGELADGKPDGRGKKIYQDGNVYEGEWKDGLFDGNGTCNFKNGDEYTGEFRANKLHGEGVMTYAKQDIYDGDWKAGRKDGKGKMKFHNGDVYEGEFIKGKMHGKGVFEYAAGDLSKSIGEWEEGKKCGLFEDIVRVSKQVYYENDEVKSDPNVKREAP